MSTEVKDLAKAGKCGSDDITPTGDRIDLQLDPKDITLVKRETAILDVPFAEKILQFESFEADRPLRNKHVDYLVGTMVRGTFRPEQVDIITCDLDTVDNGKRCTKTYRMNGQHTCWARILLSEQDEAPRGIKYTINYYHYKAKSSQGLRTLYSSIDRNAPRTKSNVVHSYCYGTDKFEGVSKRILTLLSGGMDAWLNDTNNSDARLDADSVSHLLLNDHHTVALRVASVLDPFSAKEYHLGRAAVVGAMFATFQKAPGAATEFWNMVKTGVGASSHDDPRLRLRDLLMTSNVGLQKASRFKKLESEELYRLCIHAWNAHRKGLTLRQLKSAGGEAPRPKVK